MSIESLAREKSKRSGLAKDHPAEMVFEKATAAITERPAEVVMVIIGRIKEDGGSEVEWFVSSPNGLMTQGTLAQVLQEMR